MGIIWAFIRVQNNTCVSFLKLIIYLLICFDERQKEISPLYIYHAIFGPTLELLLFEYAMI